MCRATFFFEQSHFTRKNNPQTITEDKHRTVIMYCLKSDASFCVKFWHSFHIFLRWLLVKILFNFPAFEFST